MCKEVWPLEKGLYPRLWRLGERSCVRNVFVQVLDSVGRYRTLLSSVVAVIAGGAVVFLPPKFSGGGV